jgi:LAO/AO transport system kinase
MQFTKSKRGLTHYREGILHRDRVVLAQAITLVESSLPSDVTLASTLLQEIVPYSGNSLRVGITGAPGVGKSTFIEAFGTHIVDEGKNLAVLTIDPSSQQNKGSILGDKTRMDLLSKNPHAFIRPSPSGNTLGGVAGKTRETILLCEAAGFDVILIETVGVGQSETAVKNMVDYFLLLLLPGGGDELQGIKKGIVELADGIVVTKADGDNIARANQTRAEFQQALHVLHTRNAPIQPEVITASSITGEGIEKIWNSIRTFHTKSVESGWFNTNRKSQDLNWFDEHFSFLLQSQLAQSVKVQEKISFLRDAIRQKKISPTTAASMLLDFLNQHGLAGNPETRK